jgi:GT2 family glycosyltransferase
VTDGRRLRIVVVDHNGGHRTIGVVDRLVSDPWSGTREIVVVDNASTDGAATEVRRRHPDVVVRRSERNLGFAGGVNAGLGDLSDVDLVALVNNDVTAPAGWLEPLAAALSADPRLAAASPKVLLDGRYERVTLTSEPEPTSWLDRRARGVRLHAWEAHGALAGRVHLAHGFLGREGVGGGRAGFTWAAPSAWLWAPVARTGIGGELRLELSAPRRKHVVITAGDDVHELEVSSSPTWFHVPLDGVGVDVVNSAGAALDGDGFGIDLGWLQPDDGAFDAPADVPAWSGSAVLLRAQHLREVGVFDEQLFLYYEDLELAWRARRAGWRFGLVPSSVVRHEHSATAVEGSPLAVHHIERNRLLVLTRHAPPRQARRAVARFPLSTASYARRDLLAPLARGERPSTTVVAQRTRSYLGFLRLAPRALAHRRADRRHIGGVTPLVVT